MKSFSDRIKARKKEFEEGIAEKMKAITLEIHADLSENTPVDTGWAASNWLIGITVPIRTPLGSPENIDPSSAINAIAKLSKYTYGKGDIFITNNVPYIQRLNDGHSDKAPAGFVEIAISKAAAKVKNVKVFKK